MSTFFDTISRSYEDVEITDKGINTSQFLQASESLVSLFDLLGSTAFAVVKNDMNGNIKKIRERMLSHPLQSETLQELAANESKETKKPVATEGMMWLFRGLSFTATALRRSVTHKSEELNTSFNESYNVTLKKYHSFVVRPVFALAMKACPYRVDFYKKLGDDQAEVERKMNAWLNALDNIVTAMKTEYTVKKYGEV